MNTARKGNAGENRVCDDLQRKGWVYGSRRHIGGPGDAIAFKTGYRTRLIEVKKTKTAWSHFGPADRKAMLEFAEKFDLDPYLAWIRGDHIHYLLPKDWPPC